MNQLTIMGHLGADPEVRFTSGGQKVTTLRVAENQWRAGKEETLWWSVTAWGEQFDKRIAHLKKGSAVVVTGEMPKPEIYNDHEGNARISLNMTAHSVGFSPFGRSERQGQEGPAVATQANTGGREGMGGFGGNGQQQSRDQQMSQGQGDPLFHESSDEEIPF